MTIVKYEVTNVGEYQIIERSTTDQQVLTMWCSRGRKSDSRNTGETYRRIADQFTAAIDKPLQAVNYQDLADWTQGLAGAINTRRLKVVELDLGLHRNRSRCGGHFR
jgi:hypothetical protein